MSENIIISLKYGKAWLPPYLLSKTISKLITLLNVSSVVFSNGLAAYDSVKNKNNDDIVL